VPGWWECSVNGVQPTIAAEQDCFKLSVAIGISRKRRSDPGGLPGCDKRHLGLDSIPIVGMGDRPQCVLSRLKLAGVVLVLVSNDNAVEALDDELRQIVDNAGLVAAIVKGASDGAPCTQGRRLRERRLGLLPVYSGAPACFVSTYEQFGSGMR